MSQIPQDVQNQMAPGGQFPGHAETLATPVGSDKPVRVKIGQNNDPALSLSRAEYRERSARQREIDDQADASDPPTQEPQATPTPPEQPPKKRRGRPKGSKNKLPALIGVPKAPPSGPPSPAPSMIAAPAPTDSAPRLDEHEAHMEERMDRLERGMSMIVGALAERDERTSHDPCGCAPAPDDEVVDAEFEVKDGVPELGASFESYEETTEEDEVDDVPEVGESSDRPPLRVVAERVEDDGGWDKGLQELQQMIVKRNPQKLFRQYWCQLTRAAQYNEWLPERREAFDEVFNSIVAHPKFIYQMSKFLRSSRSGNCIGNEQIARVCGQVAGFLAVYQLAAAGK